MARRGAGDEPHLNQISAHLLRGDVGDPEDALVDASTLDRYDIRPQAGLSGRVYVKPGRSNPPPWQEFLGALAVGTLDEYRNEHARFRVEGCGRPRRPQRNERHRLQDGAEPTAAGSAPGWSRRHHP
jgi:hypothetical protein